MDVTAPKGQPTPKAPQNRPPAPATTMPGAPTSPKAWKSARKQGMEVTLPSGNVAMLRRTFSMMNMLESGSIPNPLGVHIKEAVDQARSGSSESIGMIDTRSFLENGEEGQLALAQFLQMMMESMSDIFVTPRVLQVPPGEDARTWEPGYRTVDGKSELLFPEEQDAISVVDVDATDQMFAFSFAQGGAGSMGNFRQEADSAVDPAQDGGDVQSPSV